MYDIMAGIGRHWLKIVQVRCVNELATFGELDMGLDSNTIEELKLGYNFVAMLKPLNHKFVP